MQIKATLAFLAAAGLATIAGASPVQVVERAPATEEPYTINKCAVVPAGVSYNHSSVDWVDCGVMAKRQEMEKRSPAIICRDPNGCQPPCYVTVSKSMTLNGRGTWWTRWCDAGGLHTRNKGSAAWVSIGHSTTVTWSGELSLAGEVGKFLGAKIGYEVSRSRSVNQGVGCVNQDGQAHGVWLQEQMGWADTTVVSTVKQTGGGCENPGTHTYSNKVHADFPDPNNAGFRDLLAGCGSPDDSQGPWCNLDAPSLNQ